MAQSVRERIGELGVLKAMGSTTSRCWASCWLSPASSVFLGGVIGLGLSWIIVAQGDPTGGQLPTYYLPPRDLVAGFGLTLALGFAVGILPALQAMRLQVANALRRM